MVKLEDAVIARFEHSGEKFEILVDPYLSMDLRHGKQVDFDDLLADDLVFKDARKGEKKTESSIQKVFGTLDIKEVSKKIILEGEVQLTTQQRREFVEKRKNEVVNFIARNALNPQTSLPHPPKRIELALEEARFSFDLNKSFNEQVELAVKQIRKLLPISLEKLKVAIRVSSMFAGKAVAVIHKYNVVKEEWQNDGSLVVIFEVPAGVKQDLFNDLNHVTHGDFESKIMEG